MLLACTCLCTNLVMASNEPSQSTNVELDVPIEYTWIAPASLDLIEGTPVSGTIEVSKNVIPEGAKLVISLDVDNNFTVTSDEGATRTYNITKGGTIVNAGDTIMEVAAGTNNASQALNFAVESVSGKKAGTFKGTANFVANVAVPEPIAIKGDIVTLSQLGLTDVDANADSTTDTFRILSVDGSQVKLLAMDSYKDAFFDTSGISNYAVTPGSTGSNTYAGSILDTEMTNYYNDLPIDLNFQ